MLPLRQVLLYKFALPGIAALALPGIAARR